MHKQRSKVETFNFRVDSELKEKFTEAVASAKRPVAEVLREFMADFIEQKRREQFEAEARRQSRLVANSPEESEVMEWIRDVTGEAE